MFFFSFTQCETQFIMGRNFFFRREVVKVSMSAAHYMCYKAAMTKCKTYSCDCVLIKFYIEADSLCISLVNDVT